MKNIRNVILINLIPSLLVFVGRHDGVFQKLIKNGILKPDFDISEAQFWSFGIGIVWVGLIAPLQYAFLKNKMKDRESKFEELVTYNKNSLLKLAKEEIGNRNINLSTRVFKPQSGVKGFWNKIWNKKKLLIPIDALGITDPLHTNDLGFNIHNTVEGMVGKSYIDETIIVDYDLTNQNSYNLTPKQKTQVAQTKFCTSIPLFNKKDKVKAVLTIDSDEVLNLTDEKKRAWNDHIIYYAAFVNKHIKL